MDKADKIFEQLTEAIEQSIKKFNDKTPAIQDKIYRELLLLLKDLDIENGRLLNTVNNIKAIIKLKADIEKIVRSDAYIKSVADFANAFNVVSKLQNNYFSLLNKNFKPKPTVEAIKVDAINSTIQSLTESGITANVTEGIQDLLRRNITTGGSFKALSEQLRGFILTEGENTGILERYTKQITTDSLNQYSRNYTILISDDLGFEWFMWQGGKKTTSREFCLLMLKKKYIHKSEIPGLFDGYIDGNKYKVNPKTGLWYGAIKGTNSTNFRTNAGGWQCEHQLRPVLASFVPENVRGLIN